MSDATTRKLKNYLEATAPCLRQLPLMHSTEAFRLLPILDSDSIMPSDCPFFKESLLYLYYGRPSYRVAADSQSRSDDMLLPVCFVLKPDATPTAQRIFPFDSGAFKKGTYDGFFCPGAEVGDYDLGSSTNQPRRIVEIFFESNRNYYQGKPAPGIEFPFSQMKIKSYYDLICAAGNSDIDDRKSAIELQLNQAVTLSTTVLAVVLPASAMEDEKLQEVLIDKWNASFLTYPTYYGSRPLEYHTSIRNRILEFLNTEGYL